jgi:trehalose 6-phosphate phosphatase
MRLNSWHTLIDRNEAEGASMTRYLFDDMWSVGEQIARAESILLCMEFDGVLAPEMEEESLISPSPQMHRVLWSLVNQERHSMAFLSHRSRRDLQMRIGLPDVWYAGCHGLEISGPGIVSIHPTAALFSEQLQPVAALLKERLRAYPEITCQDLGLILRISIRDQPASVIDQIRQVTEDLVRQNTTLCRTHMEPDILEVRPAINWNHGLATKWLQQHVASANPLIIFLGTEDEAAFLSLDDAITIRVGENERSAAQFYLAGPPDVRRFLEWIGGLTRELQGLSAAAAGAD